MNMRPPGRHRFSTSVGVNSAIVLFNAILIAILWIAVLTLVRIERDATIRAAIDRIDNLAIAFEQYTARTIENADAVIRYLMREYARTGEVDLAKFVASYTIDSKTITGIVLADERGNAITTAYPTTPASWTNVADREHFSVHVTRDDGRLYVGKPITGRITGRAGIPLTRRINKADGTFGGVAMALIEPARFTDVLHDAKLKPLDIISLVGVDGITRARLRGTIATWGEDIGRSRLFAEQKERPVGNYLANGQLDGIPRFFSYRKLPEYDVLTTVGIAEADVMEGFNRTRQRYLWAAGLTTTFIAGFALTLMLALAAQRRATAAVARSRARALATFEQAAVGIAHSNVDGRYLDVNQRLCDILGYTREELLSMSFVDVTHPDDVAQSREFRRELLAQGGHAPAVNREKRYVRKGGGIVWCAITVSAVPDSAGNIDYVMVVVQDVSARKRAESELQETEIRFRSIFEQAGIGMAMVALDDGRLMRCNAALGGMLGYTPEELSRLTCADITDKDDHASDRALLDAMAAGTRDRCQLEKRYCRKDGSVLWGLLTATLVRGVNQEPLFMIGMLEDVTERKNAEDAVRDYSARLQQLSRRLMAVEEEERRRLGRELHDRAGANLSALLLSLEMLRRGLPADVLHASASRLDDFEALLRETVVLVRDVLTELRPPAIDEFGLLAALKRHGQRLTERTGIDIRVEGVQPAPRPAAGVEISLFRAAQEALSNATKHAEAKAITVTLRQEDHRVVLTIADDGRGFDVAAHQRGATSLGMLTMTERAEALGGHASVRSAPGEGTEVTIEIPHGD